MNGSLMKIFGTLIAIMCAVTQVNAQDSTMHTIEKKLIQQFNLYRNSDYDTRYDSLRPILKAEFKKLMSTQRAYDYPFDSLSRQIKIVKSGDLRLRIFSWDEMTGGTYHDMAVLVQYINDRDSLIAEWIDVDISEDSSGVTDEIIFEINEVLINDRVHYLCFGWGTFGSGHHHNSILIFSINAQLELCRDCINEKYTLILAPRSQKINLEFRVKDQVIIFNEFVFDIEEGFYKPTGNQVVLELVDGKFKPSD